jgi:Mn2+/Fe2+ NRAMP family transporter
LSALRRRAAGWSRLAIAAGPGLVVMLADTDAGSVITAAQSGARWGFALLLPQFALIPLMFMAQELAARVGLGTRRGLAELVLRRHGRGAALALLTTLVASCFASLLTELSGLAGVGEMLGLPVPRFLPLAIAALIVAVWAGSYRTVERLALAFGAFELAFLALAWRARPDAGLLLAEMGRLPLGDRSYLYLLAANLGTSVMPWTIFYQQSASIDKGLTRADIGLARMETLIGAVLCQCITAAILLAAGARLRDAPGGRVLTTVGQIAAAFTASLGPVAGRVVFALGLGGGALVATLVLCLTTGWAVGEVKGSRRSLQESPREAPWFYGAFTAVLLAAGATVMSGIDLIRLSIGAGVVNAVLLPAVLGLLFSVARSELPPDLRLRGLYSGAVALVFTAAALCGAGAGLIGAF